MAGASRRFGWRAASQAVPRDSAEARRLLQTRAATVARACSLLIGGFWLVQNAVALPRPDFRLLNAFTGGNTYALTATLVMALAWLALTRKTMTERSVWLIDGTGLPLVVALLALGIVNAPSTVRADLQAAPQLATALVAVSAMMFRAAFIPSPPWRTLVTSTAMAVSPVLVAIVADSPGAPVLKTTYVVLWMTVGVSIATMTSRALYGLRAAAQRAQRLGQYRLTRRLGAGAMGEVFAAEHAMLRRPTAIKLISSDKVDEAHIARFEQEVQMTARLTHPNTVTVFDYGRSDEGVFYYAMELLDGIDLQRLVDRFGPQPDGRVVALLTQVCSSLAEAHALGMVHRDIKPANIILCHRPTQGEIVKVCDFGLAAAIGIDADSTAKGAIEGTPLYLSPESIAGAEIAPATDVYALGGVAYFLLAGEAPFPSDSIVEVCAAHLHQAPAPIVERTNRTVSAALEAVVLSCLAKDPAERPPSALALRRALEDCQVAPYSHQDVDQFWQRYAREPEAEIDERPLGITVVGRSTIARLSSRDSDE